MHAFEDIELTRPFSVAAPIFASVVSLLNGARLSAGQPPLGFLNPFIYEVGFEGLTDIVLGGSSGCLGIDPISGLKTPFVPFASWNATEGWDPVTGYGTPNFPKLLELSQRYHRNYTDSKTKAPASGNYTGPKWGTGYGKYGGYGRYGGYGKYGGSVSYRG